MTAVLPDGNRTRRAPFANQGEPNTVWRNNGAATSTDSGQALARCPGRPAWPWATSTARYLDVAFSNTIDLDTLRRNG